MKSVKNIKTTISRASRSLRPNGAPCPVSLDSSKLTRTLTTFPKHVPALDDPVRATGSFSTDHMVTAIWRGKQGWDGPKLQPYGALPIMPSFRPPLSHRILRGHESLPRRRWQAPTLAPLSRCTATAYIRVAYPMPSRSILYQGLARKECHHTPGHGIALPAFDTEESTKLVLALLDLEGLRFLPRD